MTKDLNSKFKNFSKAYKSLSSMLKRSWSEDEAVRDSVIQRFEFTIETCWKFYQAYLASLDIEALYPKEVFRQVLKLKLITDDETEMCLEMIDDRNLTSHTYNEDLAVQIAEHIAGYEPVLGKLAAKAAELL